MNGFHSRSILGFSHPVWRAGVTLLVLLSIDVKTIAATDPSIHIELNATAQSHCRLTFVIENSAPSATDTLKLDLAVFDREGTRLWKWVRSVPRRKSCGPSMSKPTAVRSARFYSTT